MKILFTLITILLLYHQTPAQMRTISGRLTSSQDGSPLPGVNIIIKGTGTGTVTDAEGYYAITAPIGATLVFQFIGMQPREVVVTKDNLPPVRLSKKQTSKRARRKKTEISAIPMSLYRDTTVQERTGITTLTDETPSYKRAGNIDPATVRSIKKLKDTYVIKSYDFPEKRTGFGLQFTSSLNVESINRLPSVQKQYAQGRPTGGNMLWRGADQQELFSWGPLIRTLEFDGSHYPYDKNGRLTEAGKGNGKAAGSYDAFSFFRTGLATANELMLTLPGPQHSTFVFDLENRRRTGVIPNSVYKKAYFSSRLNNFQLLRNITANASAAFNRSTGDLLTRGANMAVIAGSVYRTPPTFDNTNGLPVRTAINAAESYQLPGGAIRTHAPDLVDNPFGLVNELPDREELERWMASLQLRYHPTNPFSLTLNANVDRQMSENFFGIPHGYSGYPAGRLTHRKDDQTFAHLAITPSYHHFHDRGDLKISLSYQAQYTDRALDRIDGFGFNVETFGTHELADSTFIINKQLSRTTHEVMVNARYSYNNWLNIRFVNRHYFSNTVDSKQYTNLFPSGSLSINLAKLIGLGAIHELKWHTSVTRTIREAPLLYTNWSYGSTLMAVENYNAFYEASELFFMSSLMPETERKFETGLNLKGFNGLSLAFIYFNNRTSDFIVPVGDVDRFNLQNAARIKNYGGTISAGYIRDIGVFRYGVDLKWSKYESIVEKIYTGKDLIPLAGFESAQSVLAPGQPVGAIYGTSYIRNQAGMKVIDNTGFPLKDEALKMIGNPIPDWTLGWSSFFEWKQLKLSFLFDFRKGGEIWNGTNAVLDYLGRSATTGELRNTSGYIFEGVDINDNPNTIPVDFSDPEVPVEDNRWVRYGWDGIGEDYIEDASWIRLNELTLSYYLKRSWNNNILKEVKLSLIGRNLLLITPYSGVDPAAHLFGYGTGAGLDLFNSPAVRSYSAQITIKI